MLSHGRFESKHKELVNLCTMYGITQGHYSLPSKGKRGCSMSPQNNQVGDEDPV